MNYTSGAIRAASKETR